MLGAGVCAANAPRDGADLVRHGMRSISIGIAALALGAFLGSQIPISPGMHVASLETGLVSEAAERESSPELPAPPRASFEERFAGAAVSLISALARTMETEEEGADNELRRSRDARGDIGIFEEGPRAEDRFHRPADIQIVGAEALGEPT